MPAIIDKIADALHLNRHAKHEQQPVSDAPVDSSSTAVTDAPAKEAVAEDATPATKTPVFNHEKVTVLFVLGGPGAGKSLPPLVR